MNCFKRMLCSSYSVHLGHEGMSLEQFLWKKAESLVLIVWAPHNKPINHCPGSSVHRKQESRVPFPVERSFPESYTTSSLDTLECSFVVFQVELPSSGQPSSVIPSSGNEATSCWVGIKDYKIFAHFSFDTKLGAWVWTRKTTLF